VHFDDVYGDYRCMGVGPRWVGLGQLFGGLDWVWGDEMDPRTTLIWRPSWDELVRISPRSLA